jgi:CyaY protein
MDDQQFQRLAGASLEELYRLLAAAVDRHDFDADLSAGAITIEFEVPPERFVVSPNAPVYQIWVSAHVQSFKLDWDAGRGAFVHAESGASLRELIAEAISKRLGEPVSL